MCIACVCVFICDYVYLSVFLYVYMCLSVCLSLCISVCLSVCICVWGRWCIHVASGAYSQFSHFFYNVLVDATHGFNKISHSPLPFILGCNMNHTPFSSQAHFFLLLTKGFRDIKQSSKLQVSLCGMNASERSSSTAQTLINKQCWPNFGIW